MPALSVFQILPPHIVCGIVNHVSGSSRMYYNGVEKGTIEYYQLQKPLLWVCHNFRAVVLSNVRRIFTMAIRQDAQLVFPVGGSRPLTIDQADSSMFHLAKELVVQLDIWSLCAGSRLEFLSLDIYKDGAFPHVRSVKFVLGDYCASENGSSFRPNALANAEAFAERILRMAPRASEVEMVTDVDFDDDYDAIFDDFSDRSSDRSSDDGQTCHSDILAQIFQLATRVSHRHSGSDIILNQEMSLVCNLVHLNFQISDGGGANFVLLAQQCAATLVSIRGAF
ncbi:hypothetical protein GGI06_000413 [Coemansia sp. S85]|nr:hypothetical protein GGI06_000413 [Coemansia sp. S85]